MRSVRRTFPALPDDIGDLRTQRPLPNPHRDQIDPFLFLNHHGPQTYPPNNQGLPFGPHPHRGFETVTFILEGSLAHADTGGHQSVIHSGGVQWMTAGRGVEHSELSPDEFLRNGGPLEILQLWVNLPSSLKMTEPRYVGLQRDELPVVHTERGVRWTIIAGELGGATGPVQPLTDLAMSTVEMPEGARMSLMAPRAHNVFFYVVRGEATVSGEHINPMTLVEFNDDGTEIEVVATSDLLLLFGHALPLREPVVSYGPFVMNTAKEIEEAIVDYRAGKFRT